MVENIIPFALIVLLLTVTPGIDMALVTRNVAKRGWRAGFSTALGLVSGVFTWGIAAGLGIAAIVATSATVFNIVKILGAAYLIVLGLYYLWQAFKRHSTDLKSELEQLDTDDAPATGTARSHFLVGFMTDVLNPQMGVLYASLLPQFINPAGPVFAQSLLLALIHALIGLVFFTVFSVFLGRVRAYLHKPKVTRAIDGATGVVFIGFGAGLATQSH